MTAEWQTIRAGDLVKAGAVAISDGYRMRNSELGPTGIPFVRGGDIRDGWINADTEDCIRPELRDRVRAKIAKPGDVAFITKGTVGRVGRLRQGQPGIVFAPQVAYWRVLDPEILDSGFVYYLFRGPTFQAQLNAVKTHGAMVADYVSITQQHDFRLTIPTIKTQRAIAHVLGILDDKIELNRRMNQTLEEMARALFKSWFVDFDPVRAKAEGREPVGMDAETASLFPDGFEDSELGPIPRGWTTEPVGDVVDVVGGSTPSTKIPEFWEGGTIHWTTPKDLSGAASSVLLRTERMITEAGLSRISSGLLPRGTLLLSSRAPVGYLALAQVPIAVNQGYIAMPPGGRLSSLFLLFWTYFNMDRIKARAGGTTFAEISKRNFRPILAIVPDRPAVDRFDTVAQSVFDRIVLNEQQTMTLSEVRDNLLPRLLSGELRIDDAERFLADALHS